MIGKLRRSQLVSTWGPGALLDLPDHAVIMSGLDEWPRNKMEQIHEPRLTQKLAVLTGSPGLQLYAPPVADDKPWTEGPFVKVFRFPEWFVVREDTPTKRSPPIPDARPSPRARRLVRRSQLDRNRFEGRAVIPTRFVRACPRGHVSDLDWRAFAHRGKSDCTRQLWLDERGTSGEIAASFVTCECKASRNLFEATLHKEGALGRCGGERPWLGAHSREECTEMARLLIRTASNAYFAQTISVLSLPNRGTQAEQAVRSDFTTFQNVTSAEEVAMIRNLFPNVAEGIASLSNQEVLDAIQSVRGGGQVERPVKLVELDAILSEPYGYEDDVPVDPNFHARRLPDHVWRNGSHDLKIASVVQLHRLRIVAALAGFTRFESETPDIHGEYESDVKRAKISRETNWYPAIEVRGEGLFVQIDANAIQEWSARPVVQERVKHLVRGHELWLQKRDRQGTHPGAAYVLLHTLSHLLMQSVSMYAGYPASSISERVYADDELKRYGILLYTSTNDADGTLGGLVAQAKHISRRLEEGLRAAVLCSNDPICAQHVPDQHHEQRWLHGASCHGCTLISETSCEMRNDHLDRGLVVPILGVDPATAFFDLVP